MTLIIGLIARDSLIMASDGQLTTGPVRSTSTKIYHLSDKAVWSASGEVALIQRVEERIDGISGRDQPLVNLRDLLAENIKSSVEQLLRLDFRTQFFSGNAEALLSLHPGDFVFAEYRDRPRILHIMANGTPEWITDHPIALGSGALFAYALLQKYQLLELDMERASVLAFKVIEEAIQVGAYGLGPPIDIWQLSDNGIRHLEERDITALEDTASAIRAKEVDILQGHTEEAQTEETQ